MPQNTNDISPQILKQYLANLAYLRNSIVQDTSISDEEREKKLTVLNSENDEMLQTFDLYKVILELESTLSYEEIVAKINSLDLEKTQKFQQLDEDIITFKQSKTQEFDTQKQTLFNNLQDQVDNKIQDLTNWQNSNDVEKIRKFEIDLSELDANTMYPVYFRFSNGATNKQPLSEVNIGRKYSWNRRSPSPFSDNSSTTHIAGLDFKIIGSDYPWGGAGWHGVKVIMHEINYMHTIQLFDNHRMPVYIQNKGDTTFTADNTKKPTDGSPVFSGFYIRGGLLYKGYTKAMTVEPTLVTTPTRLFDNAPYNRSEWVAPFPYDPANNSDEINLLGGV